jgi:hypothetical protein
LRKELRKPFCEFRIFAGETPIRTRCEKENLDGEPEGEEENVRQHDPAPPRRNLLKRRFKYAENEQNRSDHIGPQPQGLGLDRRLKKLRYRRLRP